MKKLLIGTLVSAVASLGIWAGLGNVAAAKPVAVKARPAHVVKATVAKAAVTRAAPKKASDNPSGTDPDNVQSGDQTAPDTGAAAEAESSSESAAESSGEGTTTETDGVDCQQDGSFDGVNAAGTGPGCDGSGT